jgi:DNA invertase Pin-like site-specific DNA recombinase
MTGTRVEESVRAAAIYHVLGRAGGADESRLEGLRRCCAENGWRLVEEYVDYESGGGVDAFEYERLMADAQRRRFDLVLFHALDLLCRGGCRQAVVDLARLFKLGIGVKCLEEPELDTTREHGAALVALIGLLARQESRQASRRVRKGMSRARRAGKSVGRPPLPIEAQREVARLRRAGSRSPASPATSGSLRAPRSSTAGRRST